MPRLPIVLSAVSAAAFATWKVLQWRARKRAKSIAQRVEYKEGPMVEYDDASFRQSLLESAIQRASKWCSLSLVENAKPLVGQIGGVAQSKKPVLSLEPDYVLKPLLTDHRGVREIAFYEALNNTTKPQAKQNGAPLTMAMSSISAWTDTLDTLAMALAMVLHDPVVLKTEAALEKARQQSKREQELLRRFAKFVPNYYGVVGQATTEQVTSTAHLLLQDATMRFRRPCVMDLKLGRQTYEPDAPVEKRSREFKKYALQSEFGFRIVGMRVYDAHADGEFRRYPKAYGRDLTTREDLKEAFRRYFAAASGKCRVKFLSQLRPIQRWFEENDCFAFYASSVLLVYEGEGTDSDDVTVKLIDFGRVRRQGYGDDGYRYGLEILTSILSDLILEQQTKDSTTDN